MPAALVAAILAVWRCRAAYVPLDPELQPDRLALQIADSGASCGIAEASRLGNLPWLTPEDAEPCAPTSVDSHPDGADYVTYTSGSTGQPKGVVVGHGALAAYLDTVAQKLPPGIGSAAIVPTSAADLGHAALFYALRAGRTLHLVPNALTSDPDTFAAYMRSRAGDLLKIVPSRPSIERLIAWPTTRRDQASRIPKCRWSAQPAPASRCCLLR